MSANDNHDLMQRILALNFANSSAQQQSLAEAAIRTKYPDFQATQIPFGSTVTVTNNGVSGMGKWALGLLSALGIGAGTLGLLGAAGRCRLGQPPATARRRVSPRRQRYPRQR